MPKTTNSRRDFLGKLGASLALAAGFPGTSCSPSKVRQAHPDTPDITYNTLPLWRGFNLQEKFTHRPDEWLSIAPEWGARNEPFRESDFALIRELGFNFVRLPMSYKCWCEEHDWYALKEKHLKEIDRAVEYGRQYGIHVAINFHRSPGYTINDVVFLPQYREKTSVWEDEETLKACAFHWRHFAERYKGLHNRQVSFNLFNEPVRTTEEKHDRVIRYLVSEIRAVDPNRLIVIDGFNFRPSSTLIDLKIAQCARGYNPGMVTHYLATWGGSPDVQPTWPMQDAEGVVWDKDRLANTFGPWRELERKGVGLYVGEFGVYNKTPHEVALRWMEDNLALWKAYGWGWAMWCFRGSFGIADSGRSDVRYEKYRGIHLDRAMYELLKRY
jgi:endoglucanase